MNSEQKGKLRANKKEKWKHEKQNKMENGG